MEGEGSFSWKNKENQKETFSGLNLSHAQLASQAELFEAEDWLKELSWAEDKVWDK